VNHPKLFDPGRIPPQPGEKTWAFVEELRSRPYHQKIVWTRREKRPGEISFPGGLRLDQRFDDPRGLLDTAIADFRRFLRTAGLRSNEGHPLVLCLRGTSLREEYHINISRERCELGANDTEGIRRGLVWIEDEMLGRGGPFLPVGKFTVRPVIRTRLSRCFYGPVNRPPKGRDELADDVDYYPEEYLNRLAHDGVNGLWLTLHFFQTVPSRIIPEYGRSAGPRLEKLRRVVHKCGRYGIKIYPFCIEPAAFTWTYPEVAAAAAAHPDLKGHEGAFCTSTEKGQAYLEEAARTLFTEAPGLGGLMVIPVGERFTHCYSGAIPHDGPPFLNTCPRCSKRMPWDVLADALAGLARGMQAVDPGAELIAWPYGQSICWGAENTVRSAGHMPGNVILQHNFETGGRNIQLGKGRPTWDYWLSYVGPSGLFRDCAKAAVRRGTRVSAKLQVSCSHEVATTQVVPVPGILYRKYRRMHHLGVSSAMHSWYFGAYPSLMTRAAGKLSFSPFPAGERDFLLSLARRDWGRHAGDVVKAWQCFRKGYSQYPTAHIFGYFGPAHDGPVWPLYLVPRRRPLAPTWQIGYPPSGDYIAECITNGFTLRETIILCRRMADYWNQGVMVLKRLKPRFKTDPDRLKDVGIAVALGLQFRSARNILEFYSRRESLAEARRPAVRRRILKTMRDLVLAELEVDKELLPLARADSRLGFHSEAEGYKYFPGLISWRMKQLRRLLKEEFPEVERRAGKDEPLFPDYTGEKPSGPAYACMFLRNSLVWDGLPQAECTHWSKQEFNYQRWKKCSYDGYDCLPVPDEEKPDHRLFWQAGYDDKALYISLRCRSGRDETDPSGAFQGNELQLFLEPRRTLPRIFFSLTPDGSARCIKDDGYIPRKDNPWSVSSRTDKNGWSVLLKVPFQWLGSGGNGTRRKPVRFNVVWNGSAEGNQGRTSCSWARTEPVKGRLVWGCLNPAADFGWLVFVNKARS